MATVPLPVIWKQHKAPQGYKWTGQHSISQMQKLVAAANLGCLYWLEQELKFLVLSVLEKLICFFVKSYLYSPYTVDLC